MKTLIIGIIGAIFLQDVMFAQGLVNFSSAQTGVNARFFLPADSPYGNVALRASHPYHADLFWRPGNTTVGVNSEELTNRCNFNQTFSSIVAQAGYFVGGTKTISGWVSGPIVAQVRVWHSSIADFSQYPFYPGTAVGFSQMFVITPTTLTPAANLVGLGNGVIYTLNTIAPPQTNPIVSIFPSSLKVPAGTNVTINGSAYSSFAMSYQWFLNSNPVAGATNLSLAITNIGPANIGDYYFVATNQHASASSSISKLEAYTSLSITNGPVIVMKGASGYPFRIEYKDSLRSNWLELNTITLTNTAQPYFDSSLNGRLQRFYRGVQLP